MISDSDIVLMDELLNEAPVSPKSFWVLREWRYTHFGHFAKTSILLLFLLVTKFTKFSQSYREAIIYGHVYLHDTKSY